MALEDSWCSNNKFYNRISNKCYGKGYKYLNCITIRYGRNIQFTFQRKCSYHNPFSSSQGIDLGNYKVKNPIYSPNKLGSGTVSKIATSYTSQGKEWKNSLVVWITYDSGYVMSLYHGEVKDKIVNVGDRVVVGQQIYRTGNTGHSTGDHLHCAISRNGAFIDPAPLVTNDLNVSVFKIGDEIEITGTQNIRKGNGTSYPVTRVTQVGERYVIEGGPRIADGYTWWDLKGADWIAEVGKFKFTLLPVHTLPSRAIRLRNTLSLKRNWGLKRLWDLKGVGEKVRNYECKERKIFRRHPTPKGREK
ncbi:MAG: M23 family metallopeptidase [Chitinophagales bacterium]|nr:M23 family metallopeptidase [Chitinophagales bacterium]